MNKNLQLCTIHLLASFTILMKTGYLQHDTYQQPHDKQNQYSPQFAVRVSTVGVKNPCASTLRIKSFLIVARPGASFEGHKYI